jgi:hypothetical protein
MDRNIIDSIIHGEIVEIENYFEEWDDPKKYNPQTYTENRMYDAGYLAALKWVTTLLYTHGNYEETY